MSTSPLFSSLRHQRSLLPECFHTSELLELVEMEITPSMIDILCDRAIDLVYSFPHSSKYKRLLLPSAQKRAERSNPLTGFVSRLLRGSRSTICSLLVALVYLERTAARSMLHPEALQCNQYELLLAAIMTADKYVKDGSMKNKYWAALSSIYSSHEVANIERWFLSYLDFDLNLQSDDIIKQGRRLVPSPDINEYYFDSTYIQQSPCPVTLPPLSRSSSNTSINLVPPTPNQDLGASLPSYDARGEGQYYECGYEVSPFEDFSQVQNNFDLMEESPIVYKRESPSCQPIISSAHYAMIHRAKIFHLPTGMTRDEIISLKAVPARAILDHITAYPDNPISNQQLNSTVHRYTNSTGSFYRMQSLQADDSDLVALLG